MTNSKKESCKKCQFEKKNGHSLACPDNKDVTPPSSGLEKIIEEIGVKIPCNCEAYRTDTIKAFNAGYIKGKEESSAEVITPSYDAGFKKGKEEEREKFEEIIDIPEFEAAAMAFGKSKEVERIKKLIIDEIVICQSEGQKTSRLTSLYNSI